MKGEEEGNKFYLFEMDGSIDLLDEEEASVVANRSSQSEEPQCHDGGVAKIKQYRHKLCDGKFREEVKDDIKIHVESISPGSQESSPMPVIILRAELEVAHDDGDFSTSQNEDQKHDGQEPKNIIKLVQPDGR